MIDYEALILARQEEQEEDIDCRYCEYLDICRSDEEDLPHICYYYREENDNECD